MSNYQLLINGQLEMGEAGSFDVINPATGKVFAKCPATSSQQLDKAVKAAQQAFQTWQFSSHDARKEMLRKVAIDIEQQCDELARIIVQEQGKPLAVAQSEVMGAAAWANYHAELDIPIEVIEDNGNKHITLHHKPLGVVVSITPWNWPFMIAAWHIMPALRAGNTVISKPSSLTPLSTIKLIEIINKYVPAGVINIVTAKQGIGSKLVSHSGINKIIFTGSTATGQDIMSHSAQNLTRLTLELGGNDAAIVLPNAPVRAISQAIFDAAFLNMGQTCAAIKRLYVHESIYQEMCEALVAIANQQIVGDGLDTNTTFGPVQNAEQLAVIEALLVDAVKHGAKVLCGGKKITGGGYLYPPTLVANITDGQRLVDEEQFGPILPIISYHDVNTVINKVNQSPFGLGGSVWGDETEASDLASQLETGGAWVLTQAQIQPNTPFGGRKMSGFGVEFGLAGLLECTTQQLHFINKIK